MLLLLPTLLIVSLLHKGTPASPPVGVLPTFSDMSLPGPPPVVSSAPVVPSAGPSPSGLATRAAPPPVPTPTPTPTTTRPVARFGPVTIEAEAPGNVTGGSAWVEEYPGASGGAVVRNLGDWGDRRGDGFLRFTGITVPADGTYTVKFFFVNIDNERTRTAVITVPGQDPQSVSVEGGATCCTAASVRVTLRKGTNTVTFGNSRGHAPSIDRIVLSQP